MKKFQGILYAYLGAVFLGLSSAYAATDNTQEMSNSTNSSYPSSNELNAMPNEPDQNYGSASSTHKLPAHKLPARKHTHADNSGTIYDPTAQDGSNKPTAPDNRDVISPPNSSNSGMIIPVPVPAPSTGGAAKH